MKKVLGALLFIIGLAFVVWKSVFWDISGASSLLLNILGFMIMGIGAAVFKMKPDQGIVSNKKTEQNGSIATKRSTVTTKENLKKEPKAYKTTDYSKYMPKQSDSSKSENTSS